MLKRVVARCGSIPRLDELLATHPGVEFAGASPLKGIEFEQGDWARRVLQGEPEIELRGLVELMDNNPLVCADEASVPSSGATLALIALGPLIRAGILSGVPELEFNFEAVEADIHAYLRPFGWQGGISVSSHGLQPEGVLTCSAAASTEGIQADTDIDALFEEAYGHAFYVRRSEVPAWDASLVLGKPYALYRLQTTPGERRGTMTIQVLADKDGKCGAAQLVHCMNVMAGFEESLGIDG